MGPAVVVQVHSCSEACEILVPRLGIEPVSPALASGFLTTGVPGKSSWCPSDISKQYPAPGDLSPLVDPSPHQPTLQSCPGLNKQNQCTNKQENSHSSQELSGPLRSCTNLPAQAHLAPPCSSHCHRSLQPPPCPLLDHPSLPHCCKCITGAHRSIHLHLAKGI